MQHLVPDRAVALEFLGWAFAPADPAGLVEIAHSSTDGGAITRARLFENTPAGLAEAADYAAQVNARPGVNCYFAPSLRKNSADRMKRARREDVLGSWIAWADFDAEGAAAAGRERWREVGLPPHRVVVTGRTPSIRAQAFWQTAEPFESFDDLDQALAGVHVGLAFVADPKVVNVDRVMRLPGMVAWPKPGKEGRVPELTELTTPQGAPAEPVPLSRFRAAFPPRDAMAARKNQDAAPCDLFAAPPPAPSSPPPKPSAAPAVKESLTGDAAPFAAPFAAPPAQERAFDMLGRRIDGRDEYAMSVIGGAIRGLAARLGRWPTAEELATEAWPTYERNVGPKNPARTIDDEGRGWPWFWEKCGTHARRAASGQIRGLETVEKAREAESMNAASRAAAASFGAPGAAAGGIPAALAAPPVRGFSPVRFARGGAGLARRSWLYGRHYIRGYVGATISPGGVGKSSLTIAEALAMATGRNLLGQRVAEPLRVWLWNGEDPADEITRRIAGACLHYGIQPEELEGRLFADSGRDVPISLAAQSREGVIVHEHVRDSILEHVLANRIDVVIFDPFVSLHAVGENDNGAIDIVMKRGLAHIANEGRCAIEVVHHSRKPPSGPHAAETTVDDARGAGALLAAARMARTINRMSKADAERFAIEPEERWRYIRTDDGKANMSPPAEVAEWRKLESVTLDNGDEIHPGDSVGVVSAWTPPEAFDGVTTAHADDVARQADAGQWLEDMRSPDWIGHLIGRVVGFDPTDNGGKVRAKKLFETWLENGVLGFREGRDKNRNLRKFVVRGPGPR